MRIAGFVEESGALAGTEMLQNYCKDFRRLVQVSNQSGRQVRLRLGEWKTKGQGLRDPDFWRSDGGSPVGTQSATDFGQCHSESMNSFLPGLNREVQLHAFLDSRYRQGAFPSVPSQAADILGRDSSSVTNLTCGAKQP